MSYELMFNPDKNYVTLKVKGKVTIDLIRELAPKVSKYLGDHECFCLLNDMSETNIDISFIDVFYSPEIMDTSGLKHYIKRALVVPKTFKDGHFLEIVTRNRGHNLMVFKDKKNALEWLL